MSDISRTRLDLDASDSPGPVASSSVAATASNDATANSNCSAPGTSISPVENSNEVEEMRPSAGEMFSEEVWDIVLNKMLDGAKNVSACAQVCPSFQRILKPQMNTALFPAVFTSLQKFMNRKTLLNSRLICRKWKNGVDAFCTSTGTRRLDDENLKSPYEFSSLDRLLNFSERMNRQHSAADNPFITRNVVFGSAFMRLIEEDLLRFWNATADLVTKFGKHIWTCKITMSAPQINDVDQFPMVSMLERLARILREMPNLRKLYLEIYFFTRGRAAETAELARRQELGAFRLSRMPHLEFLSTTILPGPLLEEIFGAGKSSIEVVRFQILYYGMTSFYNGVEEAKGIEKLERLKRLVVESNVLQTTVMRSKLLRHTNLQSDLQELSLRQVVLPAAEDNSKLFEDVNLLRNLDSFTVEADLSNYFATDLENFGSLQLLSSTSLRILHVRVTEGEESDEGVGGFDFLGEVPNLKELTLHVDQGFRKTKDPRERMQVSGFVYAMEESNIWELFPSLEKVTLIGPKLKYPLSFNRTGPLGSEDVREYVRGWKTVLQLEAEDEVEGN